jgi:hypothetical protein
MTLTYGWWTRHHIVFTYPEKACILKSVGIPEYYLGGNVEFLGEAWKNQG